MVEAEASCAAARASFATARNSAQVAAEAAAAAAGLAHTELVAARAAAARAERESVRLRAQLVAEKRRRQAVEGSAREEEPLEASVTLAPLKAIAPQRPQVPPAAAPAGVDPPAAANEAAASAAAAAAAPMLARTRVPASASAAAKVTGAPAPARPLSSCGFGKAAVTLARNLEALQSSGAPELPVASGASAARSAGRESGSAVVQHALPQVASSSKSARNGGGGGGGGSGGGGGGSSSRGDKRDKLLTRLALLELQTGNLHRVVQQEANAVEPWGGSLRVPSGSGGTNGGRIAKSKSQRRRHKSHKSRASTQRAVGVTELGDVT